MDALAAAPPHSDRLFLRPWTHSDLATILTACSDPTIQRFTTMPPPTRDSASAWLDQIPERWRARESLHFAVLGEDGEVVGNVGFVHFCWEHRRGEVGYWTLDRFRRRGYARESLQLISAWAFGSLELARIDLFTDVTNAASRAVAVRAGYQYEGTLREFRRYRGVALDLALYARLADD